MSEDLVRLRNFSDLVEVSLFALIDLLLGAKPITLFFIWRGILIYFFLFYVIKFYVYRLLLLHRPQKAVGKFRALS